MAESRGQLFRLGLERGRLTPMTAKFFLPVKNITRFRPAHQTTSERLRVVLVYENIAIARHGKLVCDRIVGELGMEPDQVSLAAWRIDVLQIPELSLAAVCDAQHADVVVVAVQEQDLLPPPVMGWLDQWTRHRTHKDGVLVAIFDPVAGAASRFSPAALQLRQAAGEARMEFFCNADLLVEGFSARNVDEKIFSCGGRKRA